MENLFLFCCRSCLKGEGDNKQLYTALGLESKRSSIDDIKKAYKKKSLSLHPDKLAQRGITATEAHSKEFLQVKEAYEILSDPKRRKIYDQIGLNGLKLLENPTEVDPTVFVKNFQKNRRDRYIFMFLILVFFAIVFFTPVLFSIKCDGGAKKIPWLVMWIPVWVIDAALVLSAVLLFTLKTTGKGSKKDGEKDKNSDEKKMKTATDEDEVDEDDDDENDEDLNIPFHEKVLNFVSTILFVLVQVFVLVKLDGGLGGSSKANWFKVLLPWFLYEAFSVIALSPEAFFKTVPRPDHESIPSPASDEDESEASMAHFMLESKYLEALTNQKRDRKAVVISLLRIWQGLFLAARLNQNASGAGYKWGWGMVFFPLWISFALEFGLALYDRHVSAAVQKGVDLESLFSKLNMDYVTMAKVTQAQNQEAAANSTIVANIVLLLMALLMVCRLGVSSYSTFIIIFPVFIALGCCCLAVFCGFVTLANMDPDKMGQEEFEANAGQEGGTEGGAADSAADRAEKGYGATGSSSAPFVGSVYAPPDVSAAPAAAPKAPPVKVEDVSMDGLD